MDLHHIFAVYCCVQVNNGLHHIDILVALNEHWVHGWCGHSSSYQVAHVTDSCLSLDNQTIESSCKYYGTGGQRLNDAVLKYF